MGIKNLYQIIKEESPDAIKEGDIKNQFGRKVAIVSDFGLALSRSLHVQLLTTDNTGCVRILIFGRLWPCRTAFSRV
jgi:hypothetical protein